jgi:hypothetical protein
VNPNDLSEFEIARAKKLATELSEKIARYFPEPPQDERIAELKVLREQLEKMGFIVDYSVQIDARTLACSAEVTLYVPKIPD